MIGSDLFQVRRDTQELLVSLTAASNQFLGKYESVAGDASKVPHIPDRLGVVDDSHAQIFEELLTEAYVPVPGAFEGRHFLGQIVVPSKAHPVQAIQLRSGTPSAPIIASLRKPLPDRVVRRVALWSGAGSMTEEIERQVVMAAFAQQGIEVHQVEPGDASVERFLAMYASNEFDIIWLMSHGNFDHYAPKNASLVIAENGREVGITDLLRTTPVALQRRLLMLNVCDGGRFEEIGVLPRVGVAPSAALASQATVSHLWPVHGMAAAAFGAILASNLAYGSSYFQAFRQTLLSLNVETPQVAELLRTRLGPSATALVDRIERTNIDFTNLAHSGSAVFYG